MSRIIPNVRSLVRKSLTNLDIEYLDVDFLEDLLDVIEELDALSSEDELARARRAAERPALAELLLSNTRSSATMCHESDSSCAFEVEIRGGQKACSGQLGNYLLNSTGVPTTENCRLQPGRRYPGLAGAPATVSCFLPARGTHMHG